MLAPRFSPAPEMDPGRKLDQEADLGVTEDGLFWGVCPISLGWTPQIGTIRIVGFKCSLALFNCSK